MRNVVRCKGQPNLSKKHEYSSKSQPSLLEEHVAGIGTMNLCMAECARLVLIGLIVERRRARRGEIHRGGMTLHAERVHIAANEQSGIW